MRYEVILKSNLRRLYEAFRMATPGTPGAVIQRAVCRDNRFYSRLDQTGLRARTYDEVAARYAALWPDGAEWPADVPRPEPAAVEQEARDLLAARSSCGIPRRLAENWPADIPLPTAGSAAHSEIDEDA